MPETPDPLHAIAYASVATEPFDDARLEELLAASRASNARVGVTGMLLHREGRFIQFLEGPRSVLRELVSRISADPRHRAVRVLLEDPISQRQFAEWTMGYRPEADAPVTEGFRRSFDDLDGGEDRALMVQAAHDLTRWFRAGRAA
jgi:hypothetical protein